MTKVDTKLVDPAASFVKSSAEPEEELFGKTYDGQLFKEDLQTQDVIQNLFDPFVKKSIFDYLILFSFFITISIFVYLRQHYPKYTATVFILTYIFWRLCYNLGIGIVLYNQSNYNSIVNLVKKYKIFPEKSDSNEKKLTALQKFFQLNFKIKYGDSFDSTKYPVDFNSWLLFRNFVDLILLQDFLNYFLLFTDCFLSLKSYKLDTTKESKFLFVSRWAFGVLFIFINFIVKVDAHNVIKDYAWYWGDFFYLRIFNHELKFEGIFEVFPHPMYSIGYIGYYGFALISGSYIVLCISAFGHIMQFLFLHFVEDPHINKIYNNNGSGFHFNNHSPYKMQEPMLFIKNFSFLRLADPLVLITNLLIICVCFRLSNFQLFLTNLSVIIVTNLINSLALYYQSNYKTLTKLYIKNDLTFIDAFQNWCSYYNFQLILKNDLFILLFVKEFLNIYTSKVLILKDNFFLFRIFIGIFLIILNFLTEFSSLESIGIQSYFYGDFFLPNKQKRLVRTGVYKYLNQPEKFMGNSGFWGLSIICYSSMDLYFLSLISFFTRNLFIQFIEIPHMIKLYGQTQVDLDSGVSKTFKKIIPKLRSTSFASYRMPISPISEVSPTSGVFDEEDEGEKTAAVKEGSSLSPSTIITASTSKLSNQLLVTKDMKTGCELELLNFNFDESKKFPFSIPVGKPIQVRYKVYKKLHRDAWIGLYKVLNTINNEKKTLISSSNHWIAVCPERYSNRMFGHENELVLESTSLKNSVKKNAKSEIDDLYQEGVVEFNHDLLYWEDGVYELRLHYTANHDVGIISSKFEITHNKLDITTLINDDPKQFKQKLFDLFVNNEYLTFGYYSVQGKSMKEFHLNSVNDNYISLLETYIDSYFQEILKNDDLKKNLNLRNLNSYNVENYKQKKLVHELLKLSSIIKNSFVSNDSSIDVEFSVDILMKEPSLDSLFNRIIHVQSILNKIAN